MGYQISSIENNLIYVRHDCRDALDGFIMLLKCIAGDLGGRIIQMDGEIVQYSIADDPYELIYRWDAELGIAVIVNNMKDMDRVVDMLNAQFDKLNY